MRTVDCKLWYTTRNPNQWNDDGGLQVRAGRAGGADGSRRILATTSGAFRRLSWGEEKLSQYYCYMFFLVIRYFLFFPTERTVLREEKDFYYYFFIFPPGSEVEEERSGDRKVRRMADFFDRCFLLMSVFVLIFPGQMFYLYNNNLVGHMSWCPADQYTYIDQEFFSSSSSYYHIFLLLEKQLYVRTVNLC